MTIALAILTAVAALAAYRAPISYMKPGALRAVAQIVAVLVALILGSTVAAWGPPMPGGLTFIQVVVIAILVLGFAMRKVFQDK